MAKWYVDEGLAVLIAEWKKAHPEAVVYTIGDASHAARDSEHNPEAAGSLPGQDAGEVDAGDFMEGHGVTDADVDELFNELVDNRDPRILYVIRKGVIVSSVVQPWVKRKYTGSDQHTDHLHLSVNDKFDKNTATWNLGEAGVQKTHSYTSISGKLPNLAYGMEDDQFSGYNAIHRMQAVLNLLDGSVPDLDVDGVYGAETKRKVAAVQETDGTKVSATELAGILGITGY